MVSPLKTKRSTAGFTLVELLVVLALTGIIASSFFRFFAPTLLNYINLQTDAAGTGQIATQSQRIASVIRGTTGIISATSNDLQIYSYFYPSDSAVSLVHYYLKNNNTMLMVDVTPMSANPPTGSPLTAHLRTYTISSNYYLPTNGAVFTYLDISNTSLALPVSDLNAIKLIQVNMAFKLSNGGNQALNLEVELRNRKTNL